MAVSSFFVNQWRPYAGKDGEKCRNSGKAKYMSFRPADRDFSFHHRRIVEGQIKFRFPFQIVLVILPVNQACSVPHPGQHQAVDLGTVVGSVLVYFQIRCNVGPVVP